MTTSFEDLVKKALYIGVHEIAYPIDVFSIATEISEHPESITKIDEIERLIRDPDNHFTRWAAVRALRQMGTEAIEKTRESMIQQLAIEGYDLAAEEIRDALSK